MMGGYCIEFDATKISEIATEKKLIKAKCLYDEQKQREEIGNIIDKTHADCKKDDIIELIKIKNQAIPTTKLTQEQEKIKDNSG
ncbi:MAG: DUF2971 domain-containing protein [Deltaproteobacteria bacterium]|nr:DUF2971 domain-containing protein [Deltaproteobacteria bacterium]